MQQFHQQYRVSIKQEQYDSGYGGQLGQNLEGMTPQYYHQQGYGVPMEQHQNFSEAHENFGHTVENITPQQQYQQQYGSTDNQQYPNLEYGSFQNNFGNSGGQVRISGANQMQQQHQQQYVTPMETQLQDLKYGQRKYSVYPRTTGGPRTATKIQVKQEPIDYSEYGQDFGQSAFVSSSDWQTFDQTSESSVGSRNFHNTRVKQEVMDRSDYDQDMQQSSSEVAQSAPTGSGNWQVLGQTSENFGSFTSFEPTKVFQKGSFNHQNDFEYLDQSSSEIAPIRSKATSEFVPLIPTRTHEKGAFDHLFRGSKKLVFGPGAVNGLAAMAPMPAPAKRPEPYLFPVKTIVRPRAAQKPKKIKQEVVPMADGYMDYDTPNGFSRVPEHAPNGNMITEVVLAPEASIALDFNCSATTSNQEHDDLMTEFCMPVENPNEKQREAITEDDEALLLAALAQPVNTVEEPKVEQKMSNAMDKEEESEDEDEEYGLALFGITTKRNKDIEKRRNRHGLNEMITFLRTQPGYYV